MNKKQITVGAIVVLIFVAAFFTGCGKNPAAPSVELQQLDAILAAPPALPAGPEAGTPEELKILESARILREEKILQERANAGSSKALTDGNYAFDVNINLTRNLAGSKIFEKYEWWGGLIAKAEIVSGSLTFQPGFHYDAYISGGVLRNAQGYIFNTVTNDLTYKLTLGGAYENTYAKNLYYWSQTYFTIIGGWIPAWVSMEAQIDGGSYFKATGSCWLQQSLRVQSYVKIGAKWVNGSGWSNISSHSPSASAGAPSYSYNGNLTIQPYLNVFVSAYLYSVLGPRCLVTPYLTLSLNASGRYIDTWAALRGHVYFDLKGLQQYTIWDKDLFNWSYYCGRRYF